MFFKSCSLPFFSGTQAEITPITSQWQDSCQSQRRHFPILCGNLLSKLKYWPGAPLRPILSRNVILHWYSGLQFHVLILAALLVRQLYAGCVPSYPEGSWGFVLPCICFGDSLCTSGGRRDALNCTSTCHYVRMYYFCGLVAWHGVNMHIVACENN